MTLRPLSLEIRVENRKRELISEIVEHKKNCSRAGAAEGIERAKARLSILAYLVKEGVVDGWARVGPKATTRLNDWLAT